VTWNSISTKAVIQRHDYHFDREALHSNTCP
jgi:hypothetical protein